MSRAARTTERSAARAAREPELAIHLRLRDGRSVQTQLSAARHRELHLSVLHAHSTGFIELAAGRRHGGRLEVYTRSRPDHFLAAATERERGYQGLLALAAAHVRAGEELFVGVAPRTKRSGAKHSILESRWAWIDLDRPERLADLRVLLGRKPAHMLVQSAGSGGVHAYFRLAEPLLVDDQDSQHDARRPVDWIERANMRLIHAVGYQQDSEGRLVYHADEQCRERSRVMRLAGSINGKTGRYARIMHLDLRLPAYPPRLLLGDLPDPPNRALVARGRRHGDLHPIGRSLDPYKLIPAAVYFWRLAGIEVPPHGNISCPCPGHTDVDPSCSVGAFGWHCHGCGGGWSVYDLASAVIGGPTGDLLASSQADFRAARELVRETFGELQPTPSAAVRQAHR